MMTADEFQVGVRFMEKHSYGPRVVVLRDGNRVDIKYPTSRVTVFRILSPEYCASCTRINDWVDDYINEYGG